ncbi:MAG TPA: hypothetical protein VFF64_07865 [Candidatus Eremiobacteraceae bacterium]|nr:hypothetical protein [Candidatus Eremiobacteraceae bacterium]
MAAVLLEYKHEGMDVEAVACHIKQRFPDLPIILLSAYCEMPERILWLVDEYVMKSELPERLVPIIERADDGQPFHNPVREALPTNRELLHSWTQLCFRSRNSQDLKPGSVQETISLQAFGESSSAGNEDDPDAANGKHQENRCAHEQASARIDPN